jgi:hypothetical protein
MKQKLDRRAAALAAAVVAVALPAGALAGGSALVGAAANEDQYADPGADAGCCAPDITTVAVSNDDAGDLTFRVGLGNRTALAREEWVAAVIEADDDPNTGDEGWDYVLEFQGGEAGLYAWDGEDWAELPSPLLLTSRAAHEAGAVSMTVNQDDIGGGTDLAFYVISGVTGSDERDFAPDGDGVWGYDVRSPSLAVLRVDRAARAAAGRDYVAVMSVRGARAGARIVCTATLRGKPLRGKGDLFRIVHVGAVTRERVSPRCTWRVPKNARGAVLRGSIAVIQNGLQVSRTFSTPVR